MKIFTLDEYRKIPEGYKSKWTNPQSPEYVGKRTVLFGENGGTVLLIEGIHFQVAKDEK